MTLPWKDFGLAEDALSFSGKYIMALDCGTTSIRAAIVDEYGGIVASSSRALKKSYPELGWVEQDPMEILASQIAVMMEVQFSSGIHSDRIAAVGISNQRETCIVWDRDSAQPIYNAIGWQCRRTTGRADELVRDEPRRHDPRQDGSHTGRLLLGDEDRVDPRQRERRPRARRGRPAHVRHRGQLARL